MRSHHARAHRPDELRHHYPPALHPDTIQLLADEVAFKTAESDLEYTHCDACGSPIGMWETYAVPDPITEAVARICWRCFIAILIYRGAVDPRNDPLPHPLGLGTIMLEMPTLHTDRPRDRRSGPR